MSKEEQEYIDKLKEAISEMIEDLEDIRDGIVKVSEAKPLRVTLRMTSTTITLRRKTD